MADKPTMQDLNTSLSAIFADNAKSRSNEINAANSPKPVSQPSEIDWNSLLRDGGYRQIGSNLRNDDERFELASALATQDLENRVSKRGRTDTAHRDLTKKYFKELGGKDTYGIDGKLGVHDDLLGTLMNIDDTLEEKVYQPLGGLIDAGFDNTVGNLVGLVSKDAGDFVKNIASGEDLSWIPRVAGDVATWAIPGASGLKVAGLLGKGLSENARSFNQALSGRDLMTGEKLDDTQRFANALAGTAGTVLTALPGGGILKGSQRKALRSAIPGQRKAMKEAAEAAEAADKAALDDATRVAAERMFGHGENNLDLLANARALETAGLTDEQLKAAVNGITRPFDDIVKGIGEVQKTAPGQPAAIGMLNDLDRQILPMSTFDRSIFASGSPEAVDAAEGFLSRITPQRIWDRIGSRGERAVAKATERQATKEAEGKAAKAAADTAAEKTAKDEAGEAVDEAVKAVTEETPVKKGFLSNLLGGRKKADETVADKALNKMDVLPGNAMMLGNAILQNSAALGSDSNGIVDDLAALGREGTPMLQMAPVLAAGYIPGVRGRIRPSRLRGSAKYPTYSPLATNYALRSDILGKQIRDAQQGSTQLSDVDLQLLEQLLKGYTPSSAASRVAGSSENSNKEE